jgi:hypothetical protein
MPTLRCRSPLVGVTAAILALASIAHAEVPDLGVRQTADFSQTSGDLLVQPPDMLAGPSGGESGAGQPTASPFMDGQAANAVQDWSISLFYAYETFRGVSDGNWQNNGLNTGFNFGTRLGAFSDLTGIGFQMGGSIGIYNWSGTDYRMQNNDEAETQGFLTMGFFRKATPDSPWVAGLVFDWMINNDFSVYNESPTLNQWRYHLGYDVNDSNEIGIWGTVRGQSSTRVVPFMGLVTWQSIDQLDAFFHHKWLFGPDTSFWIGVPLGSRLQDGASLGAFIAGARGDLPLNNWASIYTVVTYLRPAVGAGPAGGEQDEWSFLVGLTIFPRKDARTPTVAGEGWGALLPVASNGTFFVDASNYY